MREKTGALGVLMSIWTGVGFGAAAVVVVAGTVVAGKVVAGEVVLVGAEVDAEAD